MYKNSGLPSSLVNRKYYSPLIQQSLLCPIKISQYKTPIPEQAKEVKLNI